MRRHVRPLFLSSQLLKFVYDAVTFTATRIAIAYLGFPFLILELYPVLEIYRYVVLPHTNCVYIFQAICNGKALLLLFSWIQFSFHFCI